MDGWHHRLNGHEQTREDRQGQGSLLCCSPWSKESDATEGLNNKEESRSKIEHQGEEDTAEHNSTSRVGSKCFRVGLGSQAICSSCKYDNCSTPLKQQQVKNNKHSQNVHQKLGERNLSLRENTSQSKQIRKHLWPQNPFLRRPVSTQSPRELRGKMCSHNVGGGEPQRYAQREEIIQEGCGSPVSA